MKRSLAIIFWIGYSCLYLLPSEGRAETAIAESMEWVLATSDRVVVGKVVKVDTLPDEEKKECQAVTVAVSKTLKGTATERDTFLLPPYIYKDYAKQWMDEGIPMVFCLVKSDGKRISIPAEKFAWTLRDDGNGVDAVLLGKSKNYWTGCIPVLTRDFEVLTDPEAVLKFLDKTIKAQGKTANLRSHSLAVPGNSAVYKKLYSGSAVYLIVPVDEQLETLGQQQCKSKSPMQRAGGAQILRHFKNDKNIEILKSLLNDPSTSESTKH